MLLMTILTFLFAMPSLVYCMVQVDAQYYPPAHLFNQGNNTCNHNKTIASLQLNIYCHYLTCYLYLQHKLYMSFCLIIIFCRLLDNIDNTISSQKTLPPPGLHTNNCEAFLDVTFQLQVQNFVHVMLTILGIFLKH